MHSLGPLQGRGTQLNIEVEAIRNDIILRHRVVVSTANYSSLANKLGVKGVLRANACVSFEAKEK